MDVQEMNNQADDLGDDEGFVEEDEEGWITPENIQAIQDEMGHNRLDALPANVEVGCLTTDFSMQVGTSNMSGTVDPMKHVLNELKLEKKQ